MTWETECLFCKTLGNKTSGILNPAELDKYFNEIILCQKNRKSISKVLISTLQNLYNFVHEQHILFTYQDYIWGQKALIYGQ